MATMPTMPTQPIMPTRRPDWLRVRVPTGENYDELKRLMRGKALHTVCEEARCPNIAECWAHRTATFMILGSVCTRSCGFCAVATGRPMAVDWEEPRRVAEATQQMGLRHVVITMVNRDELRDGGATLFAATIRWVRRLNPDCAVEVLTSDFKGSREALKILMDARPSVFSHNVETVPRLYKRVRPQAIYTRSLDVLEWAKQMYPDIPTKTGFMLGLGETRDEVLELLARVTLTSSPSGSTSSRPKSICPSSATSRRMSSASTPARGARWASAMWRAGHWCAARTTPGIK